MTVDELRQALDNLPDNARVLLGNNDDSTYVEIYKITEEVVYGPEDVVVIWP